MLPRTRPRALAFREGKLEEAERWHERAVKLDSQSFLAHYYYAAIAIREGLPADRAAQIEASLRIATKLNPSFAPAFDQLAAFYGMQHKNLDEAHTLRPIAVQLDPNNRGFRLNAANVLLQMERPEDAIAVLQHEVSNRSPTDCRDPEPVGIAPAISGRT